MKAKAAEQCKYTIRRIFIQNCPLNTTHKSIYAGPSRWTNTTNFDRQRCNCDSASLLWSQHAGGSQASPDGWLGSIRKSVQQNLGKHCQILSPLYKAWHNTGLSKSRGAGQPSVARGPPWLRTRASRQHLTPVAAHTWKKAVAQLQKNNQKNG